MSTPTKPTLVSAADRAGQLVSYLEQKCSLLDGSMPVSQPQALKSQIEDVLLEIEVAFKEMESQK